MDDMDVTKDSYQKGGDSCLYNAVPGPVPISALPCTPEHTTMTDATVVDAVVADLAADLVDDAADAAVVTSPSPPPLLPWPAIVAILHQYRDHLAAVATALPCAPVAVTTPALLPLVTGRPWPAPTMVSHRLVQLYVAALFYLDAIDPSPLAARIRTDLQRDQARAYRTLEDDHDPHTFMVTYLHAYEHALLKHVHVATYGRGTVVDALEGSSATATTIPTHHVLAMTPAARTAAASLCTARVVPHHRSKRVDDEAQRVRAAQEAAGVGQ